MPAFASAEAFAAECSRQGGAVTMLLPWVVSAPAFQEIASTPDLRSALATMRAAWQKSPLRSTHGRASQAVWSALASLLADKMTAPVKDIRLFVDNKEEALSAALAPAIFAVTAGTDAALTEKDTLPSLRLICSGGTRQVVCMPLEQLLSCSQQSDASLDNLCAMMLSSTAERARACKARHVLCDPW